MRREQLRDIRGTPEGAEPFRARDWLLKNPWSLATTERGRLADIQRANAPLNRAYILKESLAKALDDKQPKRAERAPGEWLSWASRSRLEPFVKVARTIRQHLSGILGYIKDRMTNAVVEGINNRLRMIARCSYGFHSHHPLIAMLLLRCSGITLSPPLP